MRGWRLIPIVVGMLAFAGASPAAERAGPALRVAGTSPFIVRGRSFEPGERVKVTVLAKNTVSKTTQASSAGTFVVRFRGVDLGYCPAYGVAAVGNKGSSVRLKQRAPECPPPPPGPGG